ncbi:4Fe-4S cluster-binding domain-containing protein [Candidatus Desantisbacteria bacterium]|nr:4Fe-4S cluster-binding domain-containing protein [Candidatus Desantisbacteria bacterium]
MEYYIYITKNCNLSCQYCCGKNIIQNTKTNSIVTGQKSLSNTIKYIISDSIKNMHKDNTIVFYGGEPLLNQGDIIKVIKNTYDKNNFRYLLYTNGLLLNNIDPFLLKHIDYLFVSIDGEESIHNNNRGQNTYEKIINNLNSIKSSFNGETVARLTITKESKVDQAVLSLINYFDNIFWQIVSSGNLINSEIFLNNYTHGISNLLNYWISNINNGIVKNLIPFQSIMTSILCDVQHRHLRCGCGSTLRVIDIEGNIHLCDEIMCDKKIKTEKYLINDNFNPEYWITEKLNQDCENCEIKYLCGGRCLHTMLSRPQEEFRFYCKLTNDTINQLRNVVPIAKEALIKNKIDINQFNTYLARNGTEQIP